jgi:hypothetical protein
MNDKVEDHSTICERAGVASCTKLRFLFFFFFLRKEIGGLAFQSGSALKVVELKLGIWSKS